MSKRFVLAFAILALAIATAGTVPGSHSYTITLVQPAVVNGVQLKPGDYRLQVDPAKISITQGKQTVEMPAAKVETVEKKFDVTAIRYDGEKLAEIRLGGTKTRIVVTP
jgi:hypothetical protein